MAVWLKTEAMGIEQLFRYAASKLTPKAARMPLEHGVVLELD